MCMQTFHPTISASLEYDNARSQWFGRIVYGKSKYALYTTSRTFSCEVLCDDIAFRPTPVCEYLRTHVYDENSL